MKNVILALFTIGLFASCTVDSLEDYEEYNVDKKKIERPGSQGIYMDEVDKNKVQRPGSQGNN